MEQTNQSENKQIHIETERLLLTPLQLSDAKDLLYYRSKPDISAFLSWKPQTIGEAEEYIRKAHLISANTPESWYQLAVRIKDSGALVGDIGLHFLGPQNQQVELGYAVSDAYQGKGYATEAIKAVLAFLFTTYTKHRITASVDPQNSKSIQLLKRVGMRQEAHHLKSLWIDGEWVDDIIFAVLREEWEQQLTIPFLHEKV
jgi:RimJ/RimL family protein N-acetyltransferase